MKKALKPALRSQADRDRFVEQFLPLVRYVVGRLAITLPLGLTRDDLFSVGVIGLLHAATNYDPGRGAAFKTFAYTAIRGAILDEIRKHDPVPRNRRDRLRRLERALGALHARLQRRPTLEELAEHLGVAATELDDDLLALHTCKVLSLDDVPPGAGGDGEPLAAQVAGPDVAPPELVERQERATLLAKAIGELPEVERNVVVLYHYESLYLKEIGGILGVSESRVSQILTRATTRLKQKLEDGGGGR
jgi:RNA polymerase sigma factor for flagellar operon FliA